MATLDVEAPVFRGLTEFQSFAVAIADGETFSANELVSIASGEVNAYTNDADNLAVAGRDASQDEAPSGSPNAGLVDLFRLHDGVTAEFTLLGTYAQTDIGTDYGLVIDSGTQVVDKSDTSNTRVRVMQLAKGNVGDDNVRVVVRFLPANAF